MKPYVIYILGSGHSGSTILQYLLASNPNVVGLGEIRQMADGRGWDREAGDCSCGNPVQSCPFWQSLQPTPGESKLGWYKQLLSRTTEFFPQTTHLVDSSKSIQTITPWIKLASEGYISGVRVIYLVRDVRGWAVSDKNKKKRKKMPSRPTIISMLKWWKNQLRTIHYIKHELKECPSLFVSYESLIFQTDAQLSRIHKFCGLNSDLKGGLHTSVVHDVFGNRMKNNSSKRTKLIYDDRWQYRFSVNLGLHVLYPVWRLNSKLRQQGGV